MKRSTISKAASVVMAIAMSGMLLGGCGSAGTDSQQPAAESQTEETPAAETDAAVTTEAEATETDAPDEVPGAPYFKTGVYANYSEELTDPEKTYFYVFTGDDSGMTEDGANKGIGLPFSVVQTDGSVEFSFGGADEESKEKLIVTAMDENGTVHGYFEGVEDRPLVFELLEDEDATTFSAENYVNGPEDSVYHDANGWSIKYDANLFEITPGGPETFIVYQGEAAGTSMITVTYTVESGAEEAIKKLGESWGDATTYSRAPFPGAEYAVGYWASLEPAEGGSGMYETAIGRDYIDGALIFDMVGHNGEDDDMNMEVSDRMAGIIDSITWDVYDFDTILEYMSDDYYYAYADMDEFKDAMLITSSENVYDNGDGTMAASEADVYGYDKYGNIIQYGYLPGGGTATPLACLDHVIFYGGRDYMNKVHIDEGASEMIVDEGEYFDEYEDAVVVEFKKPEK